MQKVQIITLHPDRSEWRFYAHGARVEKDRAEAMKADWQAKGVKVRLLPLPKRAEA